VTHNLVSQAERNDFVVARGGFAVAEHPTNLATVALDGRACIDTGSAGGVSVELVRSYLSLLAALAPAKLMAPRRSRPAL
jgi:hypothetical protein